MKAMIFESLTNKSRIFNHPEDEAIHLALASVLYHFISAGHTESSNEVEKFSSILQQEFDLNEEQVDHLYQSAKASTSDLSTDLEIINHYLKDNSNVRMEFMNKLNQLVGVDCVLDGELYAFNEALHIIFPGIKRV